MRIGIARVRAESPGWQGKPLTECPRPSKHEADSHEFPLILKNIRNSRAENSGINRRT